VVAKWVVEKKGLILQLKKAKWFKLIPRDCITNYQPKKSIDSGKSLRHPITARESTNFGRAYQIFSRLNQR
jgi:hypothetical protein